MTVTTTTRRVEREKLPEKNGTIQFFFGSEVRRGGDGKVLRNERTGWVLRGYYGYIHNDSEFTCAKPEECREIGHQVKFKNEVLNHANYKGAAIRGAKGEKVKFASRQQRSEREGPRPIAVFMRSAERPSKGFDPALTHSR